jgi:hypothetical protein
VVECWLLRDTDPSFRLTRITTLHLVCLGIFNRKFVEKRPNSAVSPGVPNTFDNVWVQGLTYKLNIFKCQTWLAKILTSGPNFRTFKSTSTPCSLVQPSMPRLHRRLCSLEEYLIILSSWHWRIAIITWETKYSAPHYDRETHTKIPSSTPAWGTNHMFETAQYLWLTLVIGLTRATHINYIWKKTAQRLAMLG